MPYGTTVTVYNKENEAGKSLKARKVFTYPGIEDGLKAEAWTKAAFQD